MNLSSLLRPARVTLISLLLALLVSGVDEVDAGRVAAQATPGALNRAGLVVAFGNGTVRTACVAFAEEEISGDELLSRSRLSFGMSAEGAVCSIEGEGCPHNDCFCECPDLDNCLYWAYFNLDDGQWVYSQVGPAFSIVQDGSVDGWAWGRGDFDGAQPPPRLTFADICPAEPPKPPTPTPIPSPTAAPVPPVAVPEPGTLTPAIGGISLLAGYLGLRVRRR